MEGEEGSQGVDLCEAKVIKRKGEESFVEAESL